MWFRNRKNERVGDEEPVSWVAMGHTRYEMADVLQAVTGGKSYQWNLEVTTPTPEELAH